jgi:hypothetical protein
VIEEKYMGTDAHLDILLLDFLDVIRGCGRVHGIKILCLNVQLV